MAKRIKLDNSDDLFMFRRGTKYYRIIDDHAEIIRIINTKNRDVVICIDDDLYTGIRKGSLVPKTFPILTKDLTEKYKMIYPHGTICMLTAKAEDSSNPIYDVILASTKLNATSAIDPAADEVGEIFTVCRQNAFDIFSMTVHPDKMIFGISANRHTCPANFPFDNLYKNCTPMDKGQFINIYQQDDIDQILGLLKTTKADNILKNNYDRLMTSQNIADTASGIKNKYLGIVSSVEQLVKDNAFINDIHEMFDVFSMPDLTIKYENNIFVLDESDLQRLEYFLKHRIKDILIMQYNHFISEECLSEDYEHIKICDSTGKLYIVQFTSVAGFDESLYPESVRQDLDSIFFKSKYSI